MGRSGESDTHTTYWGQKKQGGHNLHNEFVRTRTTRDVKGQKLFRATKDRSYGEP